MANENVMDKTIHWLETAFDFIQFLLIGGLIHQKGDADSGKRKIPDWLLSLIAPFSDADEVLYVQLLDTLEKDSDQKKVDTLRKRLIREGYDEDVFRLMLVKVFSASADNKKGSGKNSATRTLEQLARANGYFREQKRILESKHMLERVPLRKKIFRWMLANRLLTLALIMFIPIGLIQLAWFFLTS